MVFAKVAPLLRIFRQPFVFPLRNPTGFRKRPYILPTGFGYTFGLLAFVQLVMAISAQNNLIYLFVFTEIAIAFTSMFFTNNNVYRAHLENIENKFLTANEINFLNVNLGYLGKKPSVAMHLKWPKEKEVYLVTDSSATLPYTPPHRGKIVVPGFFIESHFPFGLLRCWKQVGWKAHILVLPSKKGTNIFPISSAEDQNQDATGIFKELKSFRPGDPTSRVDWRATSKKNQELFVRHYEEKKSVELIFWWEHTSSISKYEDRISQLALWVDLAEKTGANYGLKIKDKRTKCSRGKEHWTICMEMLANLPRQEFQ